MSENSRLRFFEQTLSVLGYSNALRALDWLMAEMSAEKGFRRHSGAHYYYHPIDAAQDLLNHGIRDEPIIVSTLLHDMAEDVAGVTAKMIENMFGSRIATAVDLVTKESGVDYKVASNQILYLEEIKRNSDASLVKTADRKHNFSTLRDTTIEKKLKQAIETETYYIPFFKECRNLYPRYAHYFFAAKTAIEPHLWEIKDHYATIEAYDQDMKSLKG